MKRSFSFGWRFAATISMLLLWTAAALAVDFESFDFNDPTGTTLANAANTANPGNQWVEDPQMAPSDVRVAGGRPSSYYIVKESSAVDANFLQINNVTSGTVYLVAQMSGWNFVNFDSANQEELRFTFLNDDDADFGATITAQMNIRRNASGEIVLVGDALGDGSSNIAGSALLNTMQDGPFTAVLELNKDSNSYKVFYKDGTNPTQVLGLGAVAPTRDGNSIRMAANNSFGDGSFDYPFFFDEFAAVDRIAVTDTNPFTDLLTLEVDRTTGAVTLRNTAGADVNDWVSYSITSAAGALNPAGWDSLSTNITAATNEELAESFASRVLDTGESIGLSMPPGAWLKSPFEDLQMALNLSGGGVRTVNVNFVGNGGMKWELGDLNFDGALTGADWQTFITNAETNLSGLSRTEAYHRGDLDGDGVNSILDFIQFKDLYNTANGAGAFEAMLAGVPEPGSAVLLSLAAIAAGMARWRRRT